MPAVGRLWPSDDDGDGDGSDGGDVSDTGGFRYYGDVDDGDDGGVR